MARTRQEVSGGPKPPTPPSALDQPKVCGLNGWEPSENPHEGRFVDVDSECAGDCPECDEE